MIKTEASNQRWICHPISEQSNLLANFFEIDEFLRQFPKIQLETSEYIVGKLESGTVLARRITGFIDNLPENLFLIDLPLQKITEEQLSWDCFDQSWLSDGPNSMGVGEFHVIMGDPAEHELVKLKVNRRKYEKLAYIMH